MGLPVIDEESKKRWRRKLDRQQKEAVVLSQQADDHIERLLIKRFDRLVSVRKFVILWVGIFALIIFATILQIRWLAPYYQRLAPVAGGVYSEGLVGAFTNSNPLYATGTADTAVSRLVFSGLFKHDNNNKLVGDLASGYTLDDSQKNYTVTLRPNVYWQDGKPVTADDVVFTYNIIQNPAALSPLYNSWRDIKVTKVSANKVNFELPNSLSAFPYSLTNGIVPQHLLHKTPPEQLRTAAFNIHPVGSGPFIWRYVEVSGSTTSDRQQRISLSANKKYWAGRPKLDGFSIIVYPNDQHMIRAFQKKQINAMSGLELLPEQIAGDKSIYVYNTPLTSAVMAFFNNSHDGLGDVNLRKALVSGIDRKEIESLSKYPVRLTNEPLLRDQLGFDPSVPELPFNKAYAEQLLDQAGWKLGAGGIRYKDGKPLQFEMASQDDQQYAKLATLLQDMWAKVGVKINTHYYSNDDLQGQIIATHDYDILLYGISLGVDPDQFAYWDSSQANLGSQGHLNLSEYKSSAADQALEAGRTRSDAAVRIVKYKAFLNAWSNDAPAVTLYQPNFLYITRGPVYGYERKASNSGTDRFYNIRDWAIRQKRQTL